MSSESLFRTCSVHLLLVSKDLKRVCFKKVRVLRAGKWFFFLLDKSPWPLAHCAGAGLHWLLADLLAAKRPSEKTAELPPFASPSAFSKLFEFNG